VGQKFSIVHSSLAAAKVFATAILEFKQRSSERFPAPRTSPRPVAEIAGNRFPWRFLDELIRENRPSPFCQSGMFNFRLFSMEVW